MSLRLYNGPVGPLKLCPGQTGDSLPNRAEELFSRYLSGSNTKLIEHTVKMLNDSQLISIAGPQHQVKTEKVGTPLAVPWSLVPAHRLVPSINTGAGFVGNFLTVKENLPVTALNTFHLYSYIGPLPESVSTG